MNPALHIPPTVSCNRLLLLVRFVQNFSGTAIHSSKIYISNSKFSAFLYRAAYSEYHYPICIRNCCLISVSAKVFPGRIGWFKGGVIPKEKSRKFFSILRDPSSSKLFKGMNCSTAGCRISTRVLGGGS